MNATLVNAKQVIPQPAFYTFLQDDTLRPVFVLPVSRVQMSAMQEGMLIARSLKASGAGYNFPKIWTAMMWEEYEDEFSQKKLHKTLCDLFDIDQRRIKIGVQSIFTSDSRRELYNGKPINFVGGVYDRSNNKKLKKRWQNMQDWRYDFSLFSVYGDSVSECSYYLKEHNYMRYFRAKFEFSEPVLLDTRDI